MCELNHEEGWALKKRCFQTLMLEKTLESPLDSKELKPVNPKGNQPEYTLDGLMQKLQYLSHLIWRVNSLEKTLMLGKIEKRRRRGWQRMRWLDGITDSMDVTLSKLQETVKDSQVWHVAVHRVTQCQTWLSGWTTNNYYCVCHSASKYLFTWASPSLDYEPLKG